MLPHGSVALDILEKVKAHIFLNHLVPNIIQCTHRTEKGYLLALFDSCNAWYIDFASSQLQCLDYSLNILNHPILEKGWNKFSSTLKD